MATYDPVENVEKHMKSRKNKPQIFLSFKG